MPSPAPLLLLLLGVWLLVAVPLAAEGGAEPDPHALTGSLSTQQLRELLEEREAAEAADETEAAESFDGRSDWSPSAVEQLVIVGGGPAALSASIYAARAGLRPLVVAPPAGGQLLGKGVDVENYPGLLAQTGPSVVQLMRTQTRGFGTAFLGLKVAAADLSSRPFALSLEKKAGHPMSGRRILARAVVVATGADSRWLGVAGEQELRGHGVSSCATCDGYLYRNKRVAVIGGGDSAMEDALVLSRFAQSVTIIHRRDRFRASKVLAERVLANPKISVRWERRLARIEGRAPADDEEEEDAGVERIWLEPVPRGEAQSAEESLEVDAVFVAIGHDPNTVGLSSARWSLDPGFRTEFNHRAGRHCFGASSRWSATAATSPSRATPPAPASVGCSRPGTWPTACTGRRSPPPARAPWPRSTVRFSLARAERGHLHTGGCWAAAERWLSEQGPPDPPPLTPPPPPVPAADISTCDGGHGR